jgi:hypothetical protein
MTTNKKAFGQFYTTNYKYILKGFNLLKTHNVKNVIEPFVGKGDLVKYIIHYCEKHELNKPIIKCYDIDPPITSQTKKRDTLKNPPNYENSYVITNPPYLSRNKSGDKVIFDKYKVNDLYKCFIITILINKCLGGILIIPLNFWSSVRKSDIQLRKKFLDAYQVNRLNIFEESVFDDTSYTVCSFEFEKRINTDPINTYIFPSKENIQFQLGSYNNYIIGGEIYKLKLSGSYKISRWTKKNITSKYKTNLLLKCIDDNEANQISLKFVKNSECFMDNTPNLTARTYATLVIEPQISKDTQKKLSDKFNKFLKKLRNKYHSLFLTNYRESKDISRKRISFDLSYKIVHHLLDKSFL